MNKLLILTLSTMLIAGCSNGKIELRKTQSNCYIIPDLNEPMRIAVDTTRYPNSKEEQLIYENKRKLQEQEERDWAKLRREKIGKLLEMKNELSNEANEVYLINTSSSNIISFTVKITSDDPNKESETKIYKTNPGEEISLGCNIDINDEINVIKRNFKIVGEVKIK